jgi:hypothetical protein
VESHGTKLKEQELKFAWRPLPFPKFLLFFDLKKKFRIMLCPSQHFDHFVNKSKINTCLLGTLILSSILDGFPRFWVRSMSFFKRFRVVPNPLFNSDFEFWPNSAYCGISFNSYGHASHSQKPMKIFVSHPVKEAILGLAELSPVLPVDQIP